MPELVGVGVTDNYSPELGGLGVTIICICIATPYVNLKVMRIFPIKDFLCLLYFHTFVSNIYYCFYILN